MTIRDLATLVGSLQDGSNPGLLDAASTVLAKKRAASRHGKRHLPGEFPWGETPSTR